MTPEEIAAQAAKDFYGAPGINEDWEKWLVDQINKNTQAQKKKVWEEVKKAWGGGYFNLSYVMDRIKELEPEADQASL